MPPPPYNPVPGVAGFVTVILTVAGLAIMAAGTVAVSWLALMVVDVSGVPFQLTAALLPKLLPLTVIAKAGPPEFVESGLSCEIAGTFPAVGGAAAFLL